MAVEIYVRQLAAGVPRVMVSTHHDHLRPDALELATALNHLIDELDLGATLQRWVKDAIFGMGIMKVGITDSPPKKIAGFRHSAGQPFADVISLDDWVHDMTADTLEEVAYCGHRYTVALEFLKGNDLFDQGLVNQLVPDHGDAEEEESGSDDAAEISTGNQSYAGGDESYRDTVTLWDYWLPVEQKIVTVPDQTSIEKKPLREVDWNGPQLGPYHLLGFKDVPDNIMPLPPVAGLMELHELYANLTRKLARQAERQKTILGVMSGGAEDGRAITRSNDGDAIGMVDPQSAAEFKFGGPDNMLQAFSIDIKGLFSWIGGNLDLLGGLSPMSETLGQDKMLAQSASGLIVSMQEETVKRTTGVIRDLAYWLITDPFIELPLTKRTPGFPREALPFKFTADSIDGNWIDYNFRISPYSMMQQTPMQKFSMLNQILSGVYAPMLQIMQQQGISIDMQELTRLMSTLTDMPELRDILLQSEPQQDAGEPIGEKPPKAANTTRTNIRVNRPGVTREGADQALRTDLINGAQNDDQKAAIGRAPS